MLYRLLRAIALFLLKVLFHLEIKGQDVIPKGKSFILASNHISNMDPIVLGAAVHLQVYFLAKKELFSNRFFAALLYNLGVIPLKRDTSGAAALKTAIRILNSGKPVVIFPQGRRGEILDEPLAGVGFLFKKTHAPIVAAKIFGTGAVLPKGKKFLKFHRISIIFRRMVNLKESDDRKTIAYKVWENIKNI